MIRLSKKDRLQMGARVRAGRDAAGLSIREVAEKMGRAPNAVEGWEHGSLPRPETRAQLAELYGVDERALFIEYHAKVEQARALLGLT